MLTTNHTNNIKPTVNAVEFRLILGLSESTFYRRLAESREAIALGKVPTIPLPIFTGGRKRRLLWNRDAVMEFLQQRNSEAPQPSMNFMSEAERRKRNAAACQSLKAKGVKLNDSTK